MDKLSIDILKYEILPRLDEDSRINYSIYNPMLYEHSINLIKNKNKIYDIEELVKNNMSCQIFNLLHKDKDNIGDILYYSVKYSKVQYIKEYINLYNSPDMESCFIDWFLIIFSKELISNDDIVTFDYMLYHLYKYNSMGLYNKVLSHFIYKIIGSERDIRNLHIILPRIPICNDILYYTLYTFNISIITLCLYLYNNSGNKNIDINIVISCLYYIPEENVSIIIEFLTLFKGWDYISIYNILINNTKINNSTQLNILKKILSIREDFDYTFILFSIFDIPFAYKYDLIEYIICNYKLRINWKSFRTMIYNMTFIIYEELDKLNDIINKHLVN